MPQLFLDLDGVLADFDAAYEACFGACVRGEDIHRMWQNIRRHGSFYRDMPMMPDALELWNGVAHLSPVVLTGVPYREVPDVATQRRAWLREHLGVDVPVVCCRSEDKRLHGRPGDVLVDDWVKYRQLWVEMGGIFVLHQSAAESLEQLRVWV